jgi:hypothetical protein
LLLSLFTPVLTTNGFFFTYSVTLGLLSLTEAGTLALRLGLLNTFSCSLTIAAGFISLTTDSFLVYGY